MEKIILFSGISAIIGLIVGAALNEHMLFRYLISKSVKQDRTAFCMRRRFYYIVPENEYVTLRPR